MGGHCSEGCITDPMNVRMKKKSWGYRRMKVTFEGGQGSEGATVPHMYGQKDYFS